MRALSPEQTLFEYLKDRFGERYSEARNDLESRAIDFVTTAATGSPLSPQADAITLAERALSVLEASFNASVDTLGEATRRTRRDINQALNKLSSGLSDAAMMSNLRRGIFHLR